MNPELQQIVQKVASALAQGADPNQIAQQLMQQVQDENVVKQIMETAMQMVQQGGEGMQGNVNNQQEAQKLIETALGELGPEVLMALLMAYDSLDDANKSALQQQLQQMVQGAGQADRNQGQEAMVAQENLFGR